MRIEFTTKRKHPGFTGECFFFLLLACMAKQRRSKKKFAIIGGKAREGNRNVPGKE